MPRFNAQLGTQARTHRGTSLIEILVVLVILVVGILSIVRLFPAGFIALRDAQDASFADRLAQSALEQLKKDNAGLPDAIYMYDPNLGFNPNVAPDDYYSYVPDTTGQYVPGTNTSMSFGTLASFGNDINKQTYISNETITVPAVRMTSAGSALPLYTVNYGPIDLSAPMSVVSAPWIAQVGDSRIDPSDPTRSIDNPTDILQAGQQKFLVDLNGGQIAVPQTAYPQTFTLTVVGTSSSTPVSVTLTVPAATAIDPASSNWFNPFTTYTAMTATTEPTLPWKSATLVRPFAYEGIANTSTIFDSDPYEYSVFSSYLSSSAHTNIGVLAFNPLASGQNGTQPLQARISYRTLDWHILHEDQEVAAGTPTIRLTLNHLKKIGDVQFDQTTFTGLSPNANNPADIILLNLDTGLPTNLAEPEAGDSNGNTFDVDNNNGNGTNDTASTKPPQYQVSYLNGRITFPDDSPGGHYRVYYVGDADWALAVQKASSTYMAAPLRQALSATGGTPNNYYYDSSQSKVYFPLCDAGKTVEFDGISFKDSSGAVQQIGEASASISTVYDTFVDTNKRKYRLPYVNLTSSGLNPSNILPAGATLAPANPATPFGAVRGVSASAIVIWHEHNMWHTRRIDTLLTQSQTPAPTL